MKNNFLINNFKHLTTTPENVEQLKKLVLQMAVQGNLSAKWRDEVQTRYSASPDILQSPDYNAHTLLQKKNRKRATHQGRKNKKTKTFTAHC